MFLLSGCDGTRQYLGELITPATAATTHLRIEQLVSEGKVKEALKVGEIFLNSHSDPEGHIRMTLAQLYTSSGETAGALRHLKSIAQEEAVVSLPSTATPSIALTPDASADAGPATMARIGPDGIEAGAGDVRVSIGK